MKEDNNLFDLINCPICNSEHFSVLKGPQYDLDINMDELTRMYCSSSDKALMDQIVRCDKCDLVYLNPRIREDIALSSYSLAEDEQFVTQNPMRIRTFEKSLNLILRRIGISASQEKKVLDVGCASGAFVKVASDSGFSATGVEPSRWLCDFGKKHYGVDLRQGVLVAQGFPDQAFDIITLWDVLEHMHDTRENLNECRRILKDSGYLIANFPDYSSLMRRVLGFRWPFFLNVHLYYFTVNTITRLLETCGFQVFHSKSYWQTLELSYALHRASVIFPSLGVIQKLVDTSGLGKLPLTYNMGQTIVIARKK